VFPYIISPEEWAECREAHCSRARRRRHFTKITGNFLKSTPRLSHVRRTMPGQDGLDGVARSPTSDRAVPGYPAA